MERLLRLIAGFLVLFSLIMFRYHHPYWIWMTVIVGFNLFQSGFTNWCPMMSFLRALGIK